MHSYCCEHKWRYVHVCGTVSRILKSTMSMTASLAKPDSYVRRCCIIFFLACKNVRHTVRDLLYIYIYICLFFFYQLNYFLSLCHVFQPPPSNSTLLVVFFLCGSPAIPAFNHDYNASTRPPSAIHPAPSFHSFSHIHLLTLLLNCVRPCVVRPKHP